MRILGPTWKDGFLDDCRLPGTCRIQVRIWQNLAQLQGLYFVPPKRWRVLWNYLSEVGLHGVLRKVWS
ncbi:MAG: oxidoreductase, partial [bacterium]